MPLSQSGAARFLVEDDAAAPISKNKLKQKLRKERWEATREERRQARKAKQIQKRMKAREEKKTGDDSSNVRIGKGKAVAPVMAGKLPARTVDIRCIIDCDFDELMLDKEVASLGAQVTRCYSSNKKARSRVNLTISSVNGRLRDRMQIMHGDSYKSWKHIHITSGTYEIDEKLRSDGKIVYLTSDSAETVQKLEEGITYIVGGIVDKNRHKGLCYNKATSQDLRTAKLPIGEYVKMSSRLVLTTNQVFEIMLKWLETEDWEKAFLEVIPSRKHPETILQDKPDSAS